MNVQVGPEVLFKVLRLARHLVPGVGKILGVPFVKPAGKAALFIEDAKIQTSASRIPSNEREMCLAFPQSQSTYRKKSPCPILLRSL